MSQSRSRAILAGLLALIAILIGVTGPKLAAQMRFGIEFRGGYEIYYVVSPAVGKTALTNADVLATADILRKRADSIGMAEPDVRVEGENHIRIKLAGLTSADESRSLLGDSKGLPAVLTEKYTQTVGSVLGNTALKETMKAAVIGIACVFLLLAALYRGVGVLAAFSTIVYLWLLIALFNATHATLSLSAVVAFVLGIGMAADASIICFERVKEDLARGHDPESAIRLGFRESFPTIRDANLVTALAMIALFVAGIGPIQGFSLTMLASIAISIATNFFLVRTLCILLVRASVLSLSTLIGPEKRARTESKERSINFLSASKALTFVSILTIAAGAFYYKVHGFNLDIDFTAGTALDIDLDRSIDQDTATAIMTGAGMVPATVAIGGKDNEHIAARFDEILKPAELKKIIGAFHAKYGEHVVYEENTADPGVAREFALHAIYAVIAAFASIALYIGFRFSWSIALATVIPILHDIVLVSAIFALFKFEIDVTYIAAILTVIGYSLNDKIVIFGRIRENAAVTDARSAVAWRDLVNTSINQTLGRSIYTVLTVVMASTCLYFFACEPLEMFALALIIGLLSGAYSSIFFSSLLWLRLGAPKDPTERRDTSFAFGFASVALLAVIGWVMIPNATAVLAAKPLPANAAAPAHGPLGDLGAFQKIAEDTRSLVASGKMKEAKDRITDLETAWDGAEEKLNAASPSDWTSIDKSIDRVLALLRSGSPDQKECDAALNTLIAKMTTMSGAPGGGAATAAAQFGPLGDLEPFKVIAADTLKIVGEGHFDRAKERITELESAWDQAEETMQPKSPDDWTSIDKSIDRALAKVRTGAPDPAECEGALKGLIAKLDTMGHAK